VDLKNLIALWLRAFRVTCLALGPCFLALAFGFAVHTVLFLENGVAVDGTVVGMARIHTKETESAGFAPIFTFTAEGGKTYTVTSDVASYPPEFSAGQHVRVLYGAGSPAGARLASFRQLWLMPVMFCLAGFICWGFGYILLRYDRRRQRRSVSVGA
jgi:hypothetical protein